jgi:aspartate carbamoyltransferase regulatory subunit
MEKKKELKVSAIENGTVIDHIPQGKVSQVMKILDLENFQDQIYYGANLDSKKYGKKGIIKVSGRFFDRDEINRIALVAPFATVIEIRDYDVVSKFQVSITDEVFGFIKCINPKCVTNHDKVPTRFKVIDKEDITLRCHYCEKTTKKENFVFLK